MVVDTYTLQADLKYHKHKFTKKQKKKAHGCYGVSNHRDQHLWSESEPEFFELQDHLCTYHKNKVLKVPMQVISPVTHLTWLWMCPNWRVNFDFNFKRPDDWNDNSNVRKFNHCEYLKYHNIFDWHDFVWLRNGSFIYAGLVIDPKIHHNNKMLWYVEKIEYVMPRALKNVSKRSHFTSQNKDWYKEVCLLHYRRMRSRPYEWIVSDNVRVTTVNVNNDWSIVQRRLYDDRVVRRSSNGRIVSYSLPKPKLQHPDVVQDKPFIFSILGFDKYHHTTFTGLNAMQTHGCYFWFGNFNPEFQFTQLATMFTCQAPAILKLTQILPRIYEHWEFIMKHGCLLWEENRLIKVYGMVSHNIGDMQDKDVYSRMRGTSKHSRCDGGLWTGYEDGVRFPRNCTNLLQLGTIVPGPYRLKLFKHLSQTCVERGIWEKVSNTVGKTISLTLSDVDVFNELPINSTLKAPLEINHTTMLGLLGSALEIEWTNMHVKHNFDQLQTRQIMNAFLKEYWCNINGVSCFMQNLNTNIMVFNQIRHSWQKFLEIMISLPYVCNWCGNLNLLCVLVRLTGAFMTCVSRKRLNDLKAILIAVLDAS